MPSVFLCCICADKTVPAILIGAVAASWLGDVLLEREGFRWFVSGGLAFIVSHLLYGLSYIPYVDFGKVSFAVIISAAVIYAVISFTTVWNIRKTAPKNSHPLLLLYLFTNGFMNVLALTQMLSNISAVSVAIYIGAVLFFISDNCLFYECFHSKKPNLFVPVMATYIVGEFLIAFGLMLR